MKTATDTYNAVRYRREPVDGLDLFYDYQNNLEQYPAWQAYLRERKPPMLIVWGRNDIFFPESGAEAYKRDVRNIDFNLLETGHFALEEDSAFIIGKMRAFLEGYPRQST